MALPDKAADLIGAALDPIIDGFKTQEDCNAALISLRSQIAQQERDLQRAKLIRDELSVRFQNLPKASESGKVA